MASPYNYLFIFPNADIAAVCAALEITELDVSVYLSADSTPRDQWGCWSSRPFTDALGAAIETPITGARAVFPACTFIKWHKVNVNDPQWPKINPQTVLAGMGLTTDEGDVMT